MATSEQKPAPSSSTSSVPLTSQLLSSFKPARVFNDHVPKGTSITSAHFDDRGEACVTAGEDDHFRIFSCRSGTQSQSLPSKKYGVNLARFTHSKSTIIFASTKENDAIRYLSVHNNSFIRYFPGHKNRVTSLQMSPVDDTFLSAAVNDSVRLWDLRSQNSQGHMLIKGHPVVAYDPAGVIFAVALNERSAILLYDLRLFDQNPFLTIHLDDTAALSQVSMPPRVPVITSLEFGAQGQLLVGTAGDVHYIVDSYKGTLLRRLVGHQGLEGAAGNPIGMVPEAGVSGQEVCWTPDGKFVISGSATGQLFVWKIPETEPRQNESLNLSPSSVLSGHEGPSRVVAFNPRLAQFVSAGAQIAMWLPDELGEEP